MSEWRTRTQALEAQTTRLEALRDQTTHQLAARRTEIDTLTIKIEKLTKAGELLRFLLDQLVLNQVRTIEAVVTEGLRAVFPELVLSFQAEMATKHNKVAIDFCIEQGNDAIVIRGAPLESFGGGPSTISSLILRIMAMLKLKKFPFLLLDETLLAISDEYVEDTSRFLQKLASSAGIDVLLVTHKAAFMEHANAFQGYDITEDDGSWSVGIRPYRGRA